MVGMQELDAELSFDCKVGNDGKVRVAGRFKFATGERAVLAIPLEALEKAPTPFVESSLGFYFVYLFGTGSIEHFEKTYYVDKNISVLPMFVRRFEGDSSMLLEIENLDQENYVFIVGSCVSRDSFELESPFRISGYRARTSFAGLACPPLEKGQVVDLTKNPSAFQRRMVRGDLTKDALTLSASSFGHLVLVDFIDERFGLRVVDGTIISESPELEATGLDFGDARSLDVFSEDYYRSFARGWIRLAEVLDHKEIVVNRVFWATKNDLGEYLPGQDYIRAQNRKLRRLYEIVNAITPAVNWIDFAEDELLADSSHRWGTTPYHFVRSNFLRQLNELEKFQQRHLDLSKGKSDASNSFSS